MNKMFSTNETVRIVLIRHYETSPTTVIRGEVVDERAWGIKVIGRRYDKVRDAREGGAQEKPLDSDNKIFVIPFSQIRTIEIIQQGTREAILDKKIRSQQRTRRIGGTVLED